MATKINVRNYILTIIGILTLCFVSLICILNKNAKEIAFAAEEEKVSSTENDENTINKSEVYLK